MFYRQFFLLFITSFSLFAVNIKETELAVVKWLAIEKEKSQALRAWEQERVVLKSEVVLLKNQLGQHADAVKSELKNKDDLELKRQKVALTHQNQVKAILDLNVLYKAQCELFRKELTRFPSPLVKPLLDKLILQNEVSLVVRFSALLALISDAQALTKQWHLFDQKLKVENQVVLCQVLYAGVSKGFAVTRDKKSAFVGTFRKNGWFWSSCLETKAIGDAINNFENGGLSKSELPFFGGKSE